MLLLFLLITFQILHFHTYVLNLMFILHHPSLNIYPLYNDLLQDPNYVLKSLINFIVIKTFIYNNFSLFFIYLEFRKFIYN